MRFRIVASILATARRGLLGLRIIAAHSRVATWALRLLIIAIASISINYHYRFDTRTAGVGIVREFSMQHFKNTPRLLLISLSRFTYLRRRRLKVASLPSILISSLRLSECLASTTISRAAHQSPHQTPAVLYALSMLPTMPFHHEM